MINLENVRFAYPGEPTQAVIDISQWQVDDGERVFVVGNSGSGKSTLLGLLCGLIKPDTGKLVINNTALESLSSKRRDNFRASNIGYVAQNFNLVPYLSAQENVQLALYFGGDKRNSAGIEQVENLLGAMNIPASQRGKPVVQLSIGQQQRVAIARAIVNKPKLLIADEPTSALDQSNRDTFLSMLMDTVKDNQMSLVFVSHDLSLGNYFDRTDSMSNINKPGS